MLNIVLNVEYKLNIKHIVEYNTKLNIKLDELNIATFGLPYSGLRPDSARLIY